MIQKLIANIKKTNAPIVVGLDPMLSYIPEQVRRQLRLRNMARRWKVRPRLYGSTIRRL